MNSNDSFFNKYLSKESSFYNNQNYISQTANDLTKKEAVESVSYSKTAKLTQDQRIKQLLKFIIFPDVLHRTLHYLAAKIIFLPSASTLISKTNLQTLANQRSFNLTSNDNFSYKRIKIESDGNMLDVVIAVNREAGINPKRWTLFSNGNGEFYENKAVQDNYTGLMTKFKSNGIFFNYPGVGASTGAPSRQAMKRAYEAVLEFLESEDGIGAKEIIGYGHSIGAAVQAEALANHTFSDQKKYVFIKSRTFSSMSALAASYFKPLGLLVKLVGWDLEVAKNSAKLKQHEFILQTTKKDKKEQKSTPTSDGLISRTGSLAYKLLKEKKEWDNKMTCGVTEMHNEQLNMTTIENLATHVNKCFEKIIVENKDQLMYALVM